MSHRTESATPLDAVMVAGGQVWLRRDAAEEERTREFDAGGGEPGTYTVYSADEVTFVDPTVTAEYATEHFDELWDAHDGDGLTDREYADERARQGRADLDYVVLLNDLKGVDDGEE